MARPWISGRPAPAGQRGGDHGPSKSKVKKPAPKPKPEPEPKTAVPATSFPLNKVPTEIQQLIWGQIIKTPACHTFKLARVDDPAHPLQWSVEMSAQNSNFDPSSYRQWKELHKMGNISYETAFRRFTEKIKPIPLKSNSRSPTQAVKAAIDSPNDLVICEFNRSESALPFSWFEHVGSNTMEIRPIRKRFRHITKVAVHYKHSHAFALDGGPFQCYCAPPVPLGCGSLRLCPYELACFLDCFKNLKEFYIIVEPRWKSDKDFAAEYKGM